jgi:hypothetical protein
MTVRKGNSLSPVPCALIPNPAMVPNPSIVEVSRARVRDHGSAAHPTRRDAWMGRCAARIGGRS